MTTLLKAYVRVREEKAQSMTEYALIMAAIAVVCFAAYNTLGTNISSLVNSVSGKL